MASQRVCFFDLQTGAPDSKEARPFLAQDALQTPLSAAIEIRHGTGTMAIGGIGTEVGDNGPGTTVNRPGDSHGGQINAVGTVRTAAAGADSIPSTPLKHPPFRRVHKRLRTFFSPATPSPPTAYS